jgi:hypothetical protein
LAIHPVRQDTRKGAERLETELGAEPWSFIEGGSRDWAKLPIPEGPLTGGIDGGYVRSGKAKPKPFEGIGGQSILAFTRDDEEESAPSSKRFGFEQTEAPKSKRRLYEVLTSPGF